MNKLEETMTSAPNSIWCNVRKPHRGVVQTTLRQVLSHAQMSEDQHISRLSGELAFVKCSVLLGAGCFIQQSSLICGAYVPRPPLDLETVDSTETYICYIFLILMYQ